MPLFESQQSRNKRLLEHAWKTVLDKLEEVVDRDVDYLTHSAWLFGGAVAAQAALQPQGDLPGAVLRKAWAKGDEQKALALVEVFTLPTVSRWYWIADRQIQVAPEQKELGRRIAASNILSVFSHCSDELVQQFLGMDIQFNYERERTEREAERGTPMVEAVLVLWKALNACGYPPQLDWGKLTFPVADVRTLAQQLGELPRPLLTFEPMAITLSLSEGMRAMHEFTWGTSRG